MPVICCILTVKALTPFDSSHSYCMIRSKKKGKCKIVLIYYHKRSARIVLFGWYTCLWSISTFPWGSESQESRCDQVWIGYHPILFPALFLSAGYTPSQHPSLTLIIIIAVLILRLFIYRIPLCSYRTVLTSFVMSGICCLHDPLLLHPEGVPDKLYLL